MSTEKFKVVHPHYVVLIIRVIVIQMLKYPQFDTCLMLEPFFVSNHFHCNDLLSLVVKTLQSLAEATTP